MAVASVLPSNRTPWELAISETSGQRRLLPTRLVASMWNVDECPVDLLGWMAQQFSLDVWDEAWPETTKRETIRKALLLHRLKTTPAGIKEHVALAGAEVRRIIRPPASGFLYAAMTAEQRATWLDTLPQVRIYPFYTRAIAPRARHFAAGPGGRKFHSKRTFAFSQRGFFLPFGFPTRRRVVQVIGPGMASPMGFPLQNVEPPTRTITGFMAASRAASLTGRRATYFDGTTEIVAGYGPEVDGVEQVFIPTVRKRMWHGRGFAKGHVQTSLAGDNIVSLNLSEGDQMFAVGRGVQVANVRPQRIAQGRISPASRSFCGRARAKTFLRASFAPLMIYDRISLIDPDKMGVQRKTRSYHGHGRFGIPPYTAELRVRVPMKRGRRRSGRWHGAGYRHAADMTPLNKAIEAVRVSKAFRDTVLLDTATYGQVQFSGELRFGDFTFGETREIA